MVVDLSECEISLQYPTPRLTTVITFILSPIQIAFNIGKYLYRLLWFCFLFTNRQAEDGEYFEGNARYEGYSKDLIENIAKILNFNYRIELVPDGKYGSLNKETKKWDGLVKHLLDRVSDRGVRDRGGG